MCEEITITREDDDYRDPEDIEAAEETAEGE